MTIYAIAENIELVVEAIQIGEWYTSEMSAAAVCAQMVFEFELPFKVFKVTMEQI